MAEPTYKCLWCEHLVPYYRRTRYCKKKHRLMDNSLRYLLRQKGKIIGKNVSLNYADLSTEKENLGELNPTVSNTNP